VIDEAALLAQCHHEPGNDQVRQVYADYLEEHGDLERAEFIRLQLRLTTLWYHHPDLESLYAREGELLGSRGSEWRSGLPAWVQK